VDVFLVVLTGQGDIEVKVIDKDTWDWLNGPSGRPDGKSSWLDPFVPATQLALQPEKGYWNLTSGSWENDRALLLNSTGAYKTYWSRREALAAIRRMGDTVVDEYEGFIY
jgi:hypothetical protein